MKMVNAPKFLPDAFIIPSDDPIADTCQWDKFDRRLIEWGKNSSLLEDEGIEPLVKATIEIVRQMMTWLRSKDQCAPTHVYPDGDGGVTFEWHIKEGQTNLLDLYADGTMKIIIFVDHEIKEQWSGSISFVLDR